MKGKSDVAFPLTPRFSGMAAVPPPLLSSCGQCCFPALLFPRFLAYAEYVYLGLFFPRYISWCFSKLNFTLFFGNIRNLLKFLCIISEFTAIQSSVFNILRSCLYAILII